MHTRRALKAPAKLLCWLWTSQNTEDQPLPTPTDDFTDCGNRFPTSWILYLLTQTLHLKIKSKLYSSEKVRCNTPNWEGWFYSTRCHCWTENILLGWHNVWHPVHNSFSYTSQMTCKYQTSGNFWPFVNTSMKHTGCFWLVRCASPVLLLSLVH